MVLALASGAFGEPPAAGSLLARSTAREADASSLHRNVLGQKMTELQELVNNLEKSTSVLQEEIAAGSKNRGVLEQQLTEVKSRLSRQEAERATLNETEQHFAIEIAKIMNEYEQTLTDSDSLVKQYA